MDTSLRVRERLRLSARFDSIRRQGLWSRGNFLSVGALPNNLSFNRLGVRVQRGVKKALVRNRLKRVFRSVYQQNKHKLKQGFDLVVVLLKDKQWTFAQVEADFLSTSKRLKLLC